MKPMARAMISAVIAVLLIVGGCFVLLHEAEHSNTAPAPTSSYDLTS